MRSSGKTAAITDLGTLPGDTCSRAWGINNKGQIVGTSGHCGQGVQAQHAVLWQNGQIYDLTHVSPLQGQMTSAFYINDKEEIGTVGNFAVRGRTARRSLSWCSARFCCFRSR